MPFHLLALLSLVLLGTGTTKSDASSTVAPVGHTVLLSGSGQADVPELDMGPGLLTSLIFGRPLRLAGVEVEEEEHFSRVTVLDDALLLIPSSALEAGRKLRLRVRFVEGTQLASADFLLVMDRARTESHQVNVELSAEPAEQCGRQIETERMRTQQCQEALMQVNQLQGLTGLLATGSLDKGGIAVHQHVRITEFTARSGSPLYVREIQTYRAVKRVAVEMTVTNRSERPWTLEGAELVDERGVKLTVLRVWPHVPLAPGPVEQQMVVEAEAGGTEALGRFTLSLRQDGEPPSVFVDGVAFP